MTRQGIRYFLLYTGIVLWTCQSAHAHQQPTTQMLLDVGTGRVGVELHIPLPELELAFGHRVTENPEVNLAAWGHSFRRYLTNHIHPVSAGNKPWQVRVLSLAIGRTEQRQSGPFQEVIASLELTPPAGSSPRNFALDYDAILHQVVTHKAFVSIRRDWETGQTTRRPVDVGVIEVNQETAAISPLEIHLDQGSIWTGFRSMVNLGVEHIEDGADHMLFLIALLLPASLVTVRGGTRWGGFGGIRYSLVRLMKVVTAFTAGHSITLLAGALGWVRLPQQPIEVLIAISILVSAIHAIRPIFPSREAYVAAGFGLVHGMAFASGLAELHLDAGAMALSIFGFNLGIEAMQLLVIALTAPWFILLSLTPLGGKVRIFGAMLATAAALGWIASRISGQPNAIGQLTAAASKFAAFGVPILALIAIPAFLFTGSDVEGNIHETQTEALR